MTNVTKSMIALGFAGAIILGGAGPTLARTAHTKAPAPDVSTSWQGYQDEGYRAYGRSPNARAVQPQHSTEPGQFVPPNRAGATWDPYGLRWDGAND
jgi:hypothetical protein